ncbi:MAG TPA: alpha/beta fold hydrolase [Gemmatimonadales bacterium]|nr:alpha/beta fold hydrolase [Gemmatimonadales bacterium]
MLPVNGLSLFTRRVGAGPLVVVLHGGPGASHDYLLPQYDLLSKGRELFYYDQRGGGQSPAPREAPLGWEAHVSDLEGIRIALGQERLTICGYSWGGLLGLLYTLRHPERVERLALVAPAAITREWRNDFDTEFSRRMAAPERQAERDELRASGLRDRDPEAYQRRAFELSVMGYFKNPSDAIRLTPFRVVARTQKAVWESLGDWDLRPELKATVARSAFPVCRILHGTGDPIPIASSREISHITSADLIPLDCGHCPHVEVTSDFVRALDEFLPRA